MTADDGHGRGLVRRYKRRPEDVPPGEAADLRRRHDSGESLAKLMDGFEGSYRTLRAVLRSTGVVFRPPPTTPPAPPGLAEVYLSGKSLAATGEEFGLTPGVVGRMLDNAGVPRRRQGRPANPHSSEPQDT
ncbi:hypothetical protein VA596_23805 [Amycolatopsis sp., V23-08]|uniref:Uncharacterized protein n=1 Tax=Amycolatopsis heterodermiae TaxID=3110235 RepID=A0ABU5R8N8_9PSEU|nr:hypothetical protein [Amycolatopsis sp., V23-08]MEA5362582.1 hypothetical protein [Amycolatopsis sp., V23-08]